MAGVLAFVLIPTHARPLGYYELHLHLELIKYETTTLYPHKLKIPQAFGLH